MSKRETISLGHLLPDMLCMDAEQQHAALMEFVEIVADAIREIRPDAEIELQIVNPEARQ